LRRPDRGGLRSAWLRDAHLCPACGAAPARLRARAADRAAFPPCHGAGARGPYGHRRAADQWRIRDHERASARLEPVVDIPPNAHAKAPGKRELRSAFCGVGCSRLEGANKEPWIRSEEHTSELQSRE